MTRAPRDLPATATRCALTIAVALSVLLTPALARAGDPNLVWRTLETPHFVIHYYVGEGRLARRLAVVAEDAHAQLTQVLGHEPRNRTQVVLTDDTDDPNGSATVLPYAEVRLYATAPDDRSELNDYDDWLEELITHEYTHIVHLDTVHGIARVLNWLLAWGERGHVYAPNQSQPRFIIEGLAVFEETERTSAGRLRSTVYDMWLRTAMLEGKLQRLDQFTAYPIQFPRGASAYLYGAAFMRYIARRFGDDALRRLSHEYGGAWIPWSMNRALRRVVGKTFEELYPDFRASLADRYRKERDAIDAAPGGETPSLVLTDAREYAARPTFTRDGREVVWADSDMYSRPRLRRLAVPGSKAAMSAAVARPTEAPRATPGTVLLVDGANGSAFSPDGKTLYFAATDVWRTVYLYGDLWALDVASGEKRRLTDGLRAAEPDLSPDGKTLVFDVNAQGSRSLVTMPAEGGALTYLLGNRDDLSQAYTPTFSPDGKRVAFSWWRDGGYRDIWLIDVATRALERVTADRALDLDPRFSPDGKYLYFSSDRTGVYNLFAYDLAARRTWQVTNLVGGAFDVAIAPDGERAVYVGFQADGYRLEAIPLDPATWRPAPEPLRDRPDRDIPQGERDAPSVPYQSWRTAWPRTFTLASYPDAFGQVVALRMGGSDVVGWHEWQAELGLNLGRGDAVGFAMTYAYHRLWPDLGLSASRLLGRRGGLFIDGVEHPYTEDDYSATAYARFPILRTINEASSVTLSYDLAYLRDTGDVKVPLDPNDITPRRPETGQFSSVGLTWSWTNIRRFTMSVSPETGTSLSLAVGASLRAIGSRYNVYTASWRWHQLVPLWRRTHVLSLAYAGGISGGDVHRRGIFFLGGYAPQGDLLRSLYDFTRPGSATLRGYPFDAIYGDQYHAATVEYRFPLARVEHGYATAPIYLGALHGALFADAGNATFHAFDVRQIKVGAGAELQLDVQLGYYLPAALQLGYAHGFMKGGEDQLYLLLNNPF